MPGGGLMQLYLLYGGIDFYNSGDTWRVVYRRHAICSNNLTVNRLICNKENSICPIEYTNININDIYQHCSKCNHNFCDNSITKWLNINNTCPMCRTKWTDSTIYINKEDTCDNVDKIETSIS